MDDLGHDFASRQIPGQAALSGRAEYTANAAPYLGRYAGRPPLVIVHEDAFDGMAIAEAEENLARLPGGRILPGHRRQQVQICFGSQPLA